VWGEKGRDTMTTSESAVAAFFRTYDRLNAGGDIAATVALFAEVFLAAGTQGAQCVRAADFARALPKRKELFASLGCTGTKLVGLEETALDARYTLARTQWSFSLEGESRERREVVLASTFLVDVGGAEPRIVLYLSHQDPVAALRGAAVEQA